MSNLDLVVGQQVAGARPLARLTYWRDGQWHDLSERLLFPVRLARRLRAPATLSLVLDNSDGLLARDNQCSPLNRNQADDYDPLLDEMRKVRLEQGVRAPVNCALGRPYTCTAPTPPRAGSGGELTDGVAGDPGDPEAAGWIGWQDISPVWVQVDLGSAQPVAAVAIRCLAATRAGVRLPTAGVVKASTASAGGPFVTLGSLRREHLAESESGQAECLALVDLAACARWVRIELSAPADGGWLQADEVAVYHGVDSQDLLCTTFTGYLGDDIGQGAEWSGEIRLEQVRDTTKLLADRFIEVYGRYPEMPVEDIVRDLLTNSYYGLGLAPEQFALEASGFVMPSWTSQNQSVLAACQELARVVGWVFAADAQGVYRLGPLDYLRRSPEWVFAAGWDLLSWRKTASGLHLRNEVIVRSRTSGNREIKATARDEASIARYGVRTFVLNEPTVRTGVLARQLGLSILREYADVQQLGAAVVAGNVLLAPGQVVAVHEPAATASSAAQLFRVVGCESEQTGHLCGELVMHLELAGYRPAAPGMPQHLQATPGDGQVSLDWESSPEPAVTGYRVYQGGQAAGPFTLIAEPQGSGRVVTGLENGTQYWFQVSAVDDQGREGDPAGPVTATPSAGGGETGEAEAQWQILGLQAEKTTLQGWNTALLHWLRPAQGMGNHGLYHVYRAQAADGPWTLVAAVAPGGAQQEWYDRALRNPTGAWWWQVSYYNSRTGFEGAPSQAVGLEW